MFFEGFERHKRAGSLMRRVGAVDHHMLVVGDPGLLKHRFEVRQRRHFDGDLVHRVLQLVVVDIRRAGDVLGRHARMGHRHVDDDDVVVVEMFGEPLGRYEDGHVLLGLRDAGKQQGYRRQ